MTPRSPRRRNRAPRRPTPRQVSPQVAERHSASSRRTQIDAENRDLLLSVPVSNPAEQTYSPFPCPFRSPLLTGPGIEAETKLASSTGGLVSDVVVLDRGRFGLPMSRSGDVTWLGSSSFPSSFCIHSFTASRSRRSRRFDFVSSPWRNSLRCAVFRCSHTVTLSFLLFTYVRAFVWQMFIGDIRACQNKEAEEKRVEKELAKIREKFGSAKQLTGNGCLSESLSYPLYLLQHTTERSMSGSCCISTCLVTMSNLAIVKLPISFPKTSASSEDDPMGHVTGCRYADKQVGYAACSVLLNEVRSPHTSMRNGGAAMPCRMIPSCALRSILYVMTC